MSEPISHHGFYAEVAHGGTVVRIRQRQRDETWTSMLSSQFEAAYGFAPAKESGEMFIEINVYSAPAIEIDEDDGIEVYSA